MNCVEKRRDVDHRMNELLKMMLENIEHYGLESFKHQCELYRSGERGHRIGDGMIVFLGELASEVEARVEQRAISQRKFNETCDKHIPVCDLCGGTKWTERPSPDGNGIIAIPHACDG